MGILEPDDRDLVQRYLEQKLTVPVRMAVFTDNRDDAVVTAVQTGASSRQTQKLAEEIASLSGLIDLAVHDVNKHAGLAGEWGILAAPTIAVGAASDDGTPPRVRFMGYPGGHELTAFLETLGSVGRRNWGLSQETVDLLARVDRSIDLKTFVTTT